MCGVKEIEMDILYRLNELKNFLKVFFFKFIPSRSSGDENFLKHLVF